MFFTIFLIFKKWVETKSPINVEGKKSLKNEINFLICQIEEHTAKTSSPKLHFTKKYILGGNSLKIVYLVHIFPCFFNSFSVNY
jgi:hypothetical protein